MCNLVFTFKIRIYLFHKKPFFQKNNTWRRTCLFNCHFLMLNCLLFIQPPKNLCFVTPLTLFVLSSATDEFLKYILDKKVCTLDTFFRQIKSFIRYHFAFVFGLQTYYLIDFSKIYQLKGLESKKKTKQNLMSNLIWRKDESSVPIQYTYTY